MLISVIFARGLQAELLSRGHDPNELLQRCHIDLTRLSDIRQMLTLEQAEQLVRSAMRTFGDQGLGLTFGARAPLGMLQIFGHLLRAQPTLRAAIGALQRYSPLVASGFHWELVEHEELASLVCTSETELRDFTRFSMECALTLAMRIGRQFLPHDAVLEEVAFRHAPPSYWLRYTELFQCPVKFDREQNAITFKRAYLDHPQPHGDEFVDVSLRRIADQLLREASGAAGIGERLNSLLRYEQDPQNLTIQVVAARFGISVRTLRRYLSAEGVRISSVLEAARCRIACANLLRPDSTIEHTAKLLGFFDRSAFHRAFKRWTGSTPKNFVRQGMGALAAPHGAHASAE